jgi:ADP-ribose pyrophosphatase YjhB (NUDIX family)
LLLDADDRLLLARHDLTARHIGRVIWAPPGGGLEPGETPQEAVLRELMEEVGYEATLDAVQHVWHQQVVSSTYARDWDGAILDYFLVRCEAPILSAVSTAELTISEGITEFAWWTLSEMDCVADEEVFRPVRLPALIRDLLDERPETYPIMI